MAELIVEGIRVHYRESGSGTPVVLLHSGGTTGAQWRGLANLLGDRYRMITVDHHGCGGTDPAPGPPETHTHDAEARLVRALQERVGEPVHLVGHSYGGAIALRLVVADPGCARSLTLLEPITIGVLKAAGDSALVDAYDAFARAFMRDAESGDWAGAWERFLDGNGEPGTWAALKPEQRERIVAMTPAAVAGFHANLNDATTPEECRSMTLPTLLLRGQHATPLYQRIGTVLAEWIPGSRQAVVTGAGHMSPVTHPAAVAELLVPHLAAH